VINKPIDIKEQKENEIGILTLRVDNIITFEPNGVKNTTNLEILKKDVILFLDWTKDNKMGFLSDNRTLKSLESEERAFIQNNIERFCNKFAMVVETGMSYYIFNVFQLFNRPSIPMKAFKDCESALKWLQEKQYYP